MTMERIPRVRAHLGLLARVELVAARDELALALIPEDVTITVTVVHRFVVPAAWANGDGLEVTLRRVREP